MTTIQTGPLIFYNVLVRLRDTLRAAFVAGQAPFPRVGVVPGAIAWDECDSCGLLALAVSRQYLTTDFPAEDVTPYYEDVPPYLTADLVIQGIRCAPTPSQTGTSPTVEALDTSAQQVDADAVVILCTVISVLQSLKDSGDVMHYAVRQQIFAGPEGGCVGSELTVSVSVLR